MNYFVREGHFSGETFYPTTKQNEAHNLSLRTNPSTPVSETVEPSIEHTIMSAFARDNPPLNILNRTL
jgi:hypothetical protein